ncbi:MAG TPA: ABC transporter permease subunit [Solirubrobacteraceae bacterium]|nr:ABC transporter permease subunit [Solirubrobacteraceae bacterium]
MASDRSELGRQARTPPAGASRPTDRSSAGKRDSVMSWPLVDRIAFGLCWTVGIGLCLATGAIVLFMFVKGVSYVSPQLLLQSPSPSQSQAGSGGFLDPIEGTLLLTAIGIAIAAPVGVAVATWMSEYQRPASLARAVESGVEMISGAPSVLLALFGLVVFARPALAFLSQTSAGGSVFGKSFLTAGAMMSLIALPLVVTSTREALMQVPAHLREASYALGKTKATTIRRVLLPSVRPSIASGVTLAIGRIIGDTAIVVILLGAGLRIEGAGGLSGLSTLRGTGGTLTSYVRYNSPAGEGNAHEKAYAAAFVLLVMVLALNVIVMRLSSARAKDGPSMWRRLAWTR